MARGAMGVGQDGKTGSISSRAGAEGGRTGLGDGDGERGDRVQSGHFRIGIERERGRGWMYWCSS